MTYHGKPYNRRKFGNKTYESSDRFLYNTKEDALEVANAERVDFAEAIVRKQGDKYRVWFLITPENEKLLYRGG